MLFHTGFQRNISKSKTHAQSVQHVQKSLFMLIKYADLWHPRKRRRRDSVSFLYWLLALQDFVWRGVRIRMVSPCRGCSEIERICPSQIKLVNNRHISTHPLEPCPNMKQKMRK